LILNKADLSEIIRGILSSYISFRIKNKTESNRSRWKVTKWWQDYIDAADKLKLTFVAPDLTFERTESWIDKSVSPSLAMVFYAKGLDAVVDKLNEGLDRMTPAQIAMAEAYREIAADEEMEMQYRKNMAYASWLHKTIRPEKKDAMAGVEELPVDRG